MPFYKPDTPVPIDPVPKTLDRDKLQHEEYRHSVVDVRLTPKSAILSMIAGSNWIVDYYAQVLNKDEELAPFDPTQSLPYQQYHRIRHLNLKLQGSLSVGFDQQTGTSEISGSVIVTPSIIPNEGDAFIADTGDGKASQFTVTRVTPRTILKETAYEVDFVASRRATAEVVDLLNKKTVKYSVFHEDFLLYGQNPLLTEENSALYEAVQRRGNKFFETWVDTFYSTTYRTFMVPESRPTYDVYLMRAIAEVVGTSSQYLPGRLHYHNCDESSILPHKCVWDVLIQRDLSILRLCASQTKVTRARVFDRNPIFTSVSTSGIENIIHVDQGTSHRVDDVIHGASRPLPNNGTVGWLASENVFVEGKGVPNAFDTTYVFSNDFYCNQIGEGSGFEKMVLTYLRNGEINPRDLVYYLNTLPQATLHEFMYYGLVLHILIQLYLRGIGNGGTGLSELASNYVPTATEGDADGDGVPDNEQLIDYVSVIESVWNSGN